MGRYITSGASYAFTNNGDSAAAIAAGDVVVNGNLFGVAVVPIAVNATGTIALEGIWELPKATGAITLGQALYWDASNKNLTTTASTNLLAGFAVKAAASADTTVEIVVNHWQEKAAE